jgi:hypothetical protein
MSEFKISRLRYTWVGPWETQQFYNTDEIVQYEGKAYVCLVPHTSNSFYVELGNAEPRWELMLTGQTWRGPWTPFTQYSLDNIIIFGGIVYKCNTQHVSGVVLDTEIEYWDIYAESKTWQSEWTSSTTYGVGAIVQYGASVYECTVSHVSAATDLEGLESDYDSDDSTLTKWKVLKEGVSWRGEYATATQDSSQLRYKLNDIVRYGPTLYRCVVGHAPSEGFDDFSTVLTDTFISQYWEEWLPGLDFDGLWNSNIIYQPGDVVLYGGYIYSNKRINNINLRPSFNSEDSTDAWELIVRAFDVEGSWNNATYYEVGSVITYGGDVYVAIVDSIDEAPGDREVSVVYNSTGSSGATLKVSSTTDLRIGMTAIGEGFASGQFVQRIVDATTVVLNKAPDSTITNGVTLIFAGVNALFWELLIPGISWKARWQDAALYNQDDLVYYGNATYKCIREHTSSFVTRPDNDLVNNYWVVYLQHYQGNALQAPGEMITSDANGTTALAIGADTNVLKVVDGLPEWSEIFFTPAVYYVAENGIDSPDRGTTWDIPWRSIRYACEQVQEGVLYPNAKVLLRENKEFIVQEAFYWMKIQQLGNIFPFDTIGLIIDDDKTIRDLQYIVDAVIYDLIRGGNSQTVAATLAYFDLGSTNKFANDNVAEQIETFVVVLDKLFSLMQSVLTNTIPAENYQTILGISPKVEQYFNSQLTASSEITNIVSALENILLTALVNGNVENVPTSNERLTVTISIRSGTYDEQLPIVVPSNAALNGDELRGVVVRPGNPINTLCTRTIGFIDQFVVGSTANMQNNTPVQFVSLNPIVETSTIIGGVNGGQTYYVIGSSITATTFQVSEVPDGPPVSLVTNIGFMYVYGGDALSDMFYVQNGTGIRNMTLTGLLGTLTPENQFLTRRPTGGVYVSLDPGQGPDDTSAWIIRKSPYIQNVTTFGTGCVGLKIDSTLHNGGNRSIVCNDFTQILSDGIGVWCTGGDALTEAVSVFSYYNYTGYFAEAGGRIRATNGNSSYGTYGCVAEGFDPGETPALGNIDNKSNQARASAVSALGADAEILKIQYIHAGEEYDTVTTNSIKYSNSLLDPAWLTDSNINVIRASSTPFAGQEAWRVTANTSLSDSSYFYQNIEVAPQGRTYSNIAGENITGSGVDATFDVTVFSDRYVVAVNQGGSGYVVGNQIRLSGKNFGGKTGLLIGSNDITVTVATLAITSVLTVNFTGNVPTGSALPYTLSIFAKKNTAQFFDLYATFSGYDTRTSYVRYNFDTNEILTNGTGDLGIVPSIDNRGAEFIEDGWYRIWFTVYDETAQNTQLEYKVYPRGKDGIAGSTNFFGAQLQVGTGLGFYLGTEENTPTAHANINIQGAGRNVRVLADELRSGSIFQTRILEVTGVQPGGLGYVTQTNNAQTGTDEFITLAQSEVATAARYEGMRVSISSGKGAGQFGRISRYSPITKNAFILKESFETLEILESDDATDRFTLDADADIKTLFPNQKIQFTPTFYEVNVSESSQNSVEVIETEGDLSNVMTVTSTVRLRENMAINFSGTTFGGVISNFTYYILDIIDDTKIQISTSSGGGVWPLNNETGSMILNYPSNTSYLVASSTDDMQVTFPIQFTGNSIGGITLGTTYYIHDIYSPTQFSIAASKAEINITGTNSTGNIVVTDDTTPLIPLNPIIFKGGSFGNLVENTRYYVNRVLDGTTFTIADSVLTRTATATQIGSNLITVDSTAGFVANRPIVFTGTVFGGIVNDRVYYIQVVNNATTFTISETPGGTAVILTNATGSLITRTTANVVTQTTASGTTIGVTTGVKEVLTSGSGSMEASFFTETFGAIEQGTTYYVLDIFDTDPKQFTVTSTSGGTTPVSLTSNLGSMQLGAVGWDHINPGTPLVTSFDSTSVYTIEPRIVYSTPPFVEEPTIAISLLTPPEEYFKVVSSGYSAIAIPRIGDQVLVLSNSSDNWQPDIVLPLEATLAGNGGWQDSEYGNNTWVIVSANGQAVSSVSDGATWLTSTMPTPTGGAYSALAYGDGTFVAVAQDSAVAAYSNNNGGSWTGVTQSIGDNNWVDIAYGNETFVAISNTSNTIKYSTNNGVTWQSASLGSGATTNWTQVEFGNGRFVAVSGSLRTSVYSFDGITWYQSSLSVKGTKLKYGQGVFLLLDPNFATAYTSEDGFTWKQRTVSPAPYAAIGFNYNLFTKKGYFLTLSSDLSTSRISAGCIAKGRATIDSGTISNISMWEPGSGYIADDSTSPTIRIVDPNNSQDAGVQLRIGNGTLGAPTFVNPGQGYNTTSTTITINGDGYADQFQTGLRLVVKNLTRLPAPGDNLEIQGNSQTYRVAAARILRGSQVPNLAVEIQISPVMTQEFSPEDNAPFTLRSRFSQVRLTNHDFLNIGFGNEFQSNYPGAPLNTGLEPQDEIVETNNGRVFYSSTDQDGNFRVGDLFAVEQATGIVTLNASEFGLEGLTDLTIGGVALGGSPVVISQFSTDATFVANSNNIVPTQRAVRTYLASRLSQGGSDTFTGLLTAGTVKIGGPDEINSTVVEGGEGFQIRIGTKANISGIDGGMIDGDGMAMSYFMRTFFDPTRQGLQ